MVSGKSNLNVQYRPVDALQPRSTNPRTHTRKQIGQIADSIRQFGFTSPILIDGEDGIVAGHGRVEAAKLLGMASVPTIRLEHLSAPEIRAYLIADNRLAELAGWDPEILAIELQALSELDLEFDLEIIGYETAEIDLLIQNLEPDPGDDADQVPEPDPGVPPVSRPGDLWQLGGHRLLCGDAREPAAFDRLMAGDKAGMAFTDPPYNVPILGHVSGKGVVKHANFAMASGEMAESEFITFLETALGNIARSSIDGAIQFVCIDWRHFAALLAAGGNAGLDLLNLCVWVKSNGGMGSLYRSQHELVCVFKNGSAPHVNNVELGRHGRNRTNVWHYPGMNSLQAGRLDNLRMHPTVKPTQLVADAILDCSKRASIVLDPFAGSGTTIIAAERTRRHARAMEVDPGYVDTALRRWEKVTGEAAVLEGTGMTFEAVAASRPGDQVHSRDRGVAEPDGQPIGGTEETDGRQEG